MDIPCGAAILASGSWSCPLPARARPALGCPSSGSQHNGRFCATLVKGVGEAPNLLTQQRTTGWYTVREELQSSRRGKICCEAESCSSCKSGCWRGTRGACAVVLGQLRWQCSEKCSCCQFKHFSGFCLVRHKLHVCVLAVRHWGNHRGNMFLSGLAASSGLCCEDFSQERVKLFLAVRLVDQGCLCSERIQIPCRGLGQLGHPALGCQQPWARTCWIEGGHCLVAAGGHQCWLWLAKAVLVLCISRLLCLDDKR